MRACASTNTHAGTVNGATKTAGRIGANPNELSFFDGMIDEVRIYDRALILDEIGNLLTVRISILGLIHDCLSLSFD